MGGFTREAGSDVNCYSMPAPSRGSIEILSQGKVLAGYVEDMSEAQCDYSGEAVGAFSADFKLKFRFIG